VKLVSQGIYAILKQNLLKWTISNKNMENKSVGYIIIAISILMIVIVIMFKSALTSFVDSSCTLAHGEGSCPMYDTITKQTYLALGIIGILLVVGIALMFSKPQTKTIVKTVEKKRKEINHDLSTLKPEEKKVFKMIQENKTIFQADLIEKTGLGKAKITRILDRLEGRNFIERKRRGMTNVVVLKE